MTVRAAAAPGRLAVTQPGLDRRTPRPRRRRTHPGRAADHRPARRPGPRRRRPDERAPGGDPGPRPRRRDPPPAAWRDRRGRGLHGRPVVLAGPRRAHRAGRAATASALALDAGWWHRLLQLPLRLAHRARRNTVRRRAAQHPRPLRPGQRPVPAVPRRDDDVLGGRLRGRRPDPRRRPAGQVPAAGRRRRPGAPACTSSRSARAGAGSPCTRPASAAAGSRRSRSRPSSTPSPASASARPGWSTSSTSSCATTATSRARSTRSCPSRCSRPSGPSTTTRTSGPSTGRSSPGGRFALQVITFPDVAYEAQRRGANWIQTYIFPGGLCPSLAVIERSLAGTRLLVREARDIAPGYVRTLAAWRERFLANADAVRALGFDERFIRMWEYYLALSQAGFATGLSQDHQIVLEKGARARARSLALSPGRGAAAARRRPAAPRRASRPAARRGARGPPATS